MTFPQSPWFWAFVGGIAVWLAREIVGTNIKRAIARTGKIEYIRHRCGFFGIADLEDGRSVVSLYNPDDFFLDRASIDVVVDGELCNDTDTQVVFTEAHVRFLGPDGDRILHKRPKMLVNGESALTITVPAHGAVKLRFHVPVFRESLSTTYNQTIPVLDLMSPSRKTLTFRLGGASIYGDPPSFWGRKGQFPVIADRLRKEEFNEDSALDNLADSAEESR